MRTFCKDCGSAISYENKNDSNTIDINTMLLDNPEVFTVKYHVWTKRQLPGIIIDENIQKFSENSDLWKELRQD
ncbi:MAG: GFA family protein [Candidatus Marinimicrobia bacterium]|nr:GFA family protein [Candidatus Neomarinimicrobiota bacterium]